MSGPGGYQLGVDLGTTYTAAAVARDGHHRMVGLGNRSAAIPSVVHLSADGTVRAGDAADRRGPSEPDRVAREFKRRIGDPTPLLLGGSPYSSEALLGTLLDMVVTRVATLEGGPPNHLTVTHPANWGPFKRELFEQCLRGADVGSTSTVTEPEAAAISYAANERVEPGSLVAVYDLGGGTFDVAILRKTGDGFSILGRPEGIERLGGIDFDEAVVGHVRTALGGALDRLDSSDPAILSALIRLRRDCTEAKEALSSDTEVTIPVLLPGLQTDVRLTRAEFERMIRPALDATIDAMRRALATAAVETYEIGTILLVGGSSRIPLVGELVSQAFGRPIALDAHPKHAIALGAAHAAELTVGEVATEVDGGRVIAFGSHGATGAAQDQWDETTAELDIAAVVAASAGVGAAATASAEVAPGPDVAPSASQQQHRQWDRRPYDDDPVQPPDWVASPQPAADRSRRRLYTAVIAFVILSVLTIGAGAFVSSSPRSEARGDTPTVRGTPATEWYGEVPEDDDTTTADTPIAEAVPSTDDGPNSSANSAADVGGSGDTGTGGGGGSATTASSSGGGSDAGADGSGSSKPKGDAKTGNKGSDPDPEPRPDPPADPDPGDDPATESPSESAGGGGGGDGGGSGAGGGGDDGGGQDAGEAQVDGGSDALDPGTPAQS